MIIDDKGRIFGRISVIDLFVVVMVSAVFAVAFLKIANTSRTAVKNPDQKIQITFYKEALEDFTANSVKIGDRVENDTNGTFMGTVTGVELGESINYMPDINGIERATPMEGHSSIKITSEVTGKLSDGALLLNGNLYGSGSQIIIWVGKAKIQLYISDVQALR